jgi:hypothetical protein
MYSVWTIHQAKYIDARLREVVVLCRDDPEPPVFFYEETVMTVEEVIQNMCMGDLFYAQWGENCLDIEITNYGTSEESIEVLPNRYGEACNSLAKLPCYEHAF